MHMFCHTCPSSSSYNDGSQEMLTIVPMMSLLYARSCAMLMTELFPDNGSLVIWWYTGGVIYKNEGRRNNSEAIFDLPQLPQAGRWTNRLG